MLFYFSLSLFFFCFYRHHFVDRHIVRHWPTIVGGFCLLAAAFEPRGRTRTSGGRSPKVALNGHSVGWLADFQLQLCSFAARGPFWPEIDRLSQAFGPLFGPFEWAILVGDNRNGLQPKMGDRLRQKWQNGKQVCNWVNKHGKGCLY